MFSRLLTVEKIFIYVWGLVLPWQTIWIYRYGFLNGVSSPYLTLGWYASEVLLWALFLVVLWNARKRLCKKQLTMSKKQLLILGLLCAFPLYVFMRSWWSADIDLSLRYALYIIEGYMLLIAILVSGTSGRDWLRAFLFGSIAPVVLGLYQWFLQSTFGSTLFGLSEHLPSQAGASIVAAGEIGRWLRAYGPFPHPNIFAGYLVLIALVTFLYTNYIQSSRERIAVGILHVFTVFILCTTFSRSAIFAYFFLVLGFGIYAVIHRAKLLFGILGVGITIACSFFGIYHDLVRVRVVPVSVSETRSIDERQAGIGIAQQLFMQHPVFGFGGGMSVSAWHALDSSLPGYVYQPVHVVPLVVLVEYGVVGFLLLLCSLVGFIMVAASNRTFVALGLLVPVMCIGVFDHYFATLYPGILIFFAYFGIVLHFSTRSPQTVPIS